MWLLQDCSVARRALACKPVSCRQSEATQMLYGGHVQAVQPLKEQLPIERARMRLKIQVPSGSREELMALLQSRQAAIESQDLGLSNNQVKTASHMPQRGLGFWPRVW